LGVINAGMTRLLAAKVMGPLVAHGAHVSTAALLVAGSIPFARRRGFRLREIWHIGFQLCAQHTQDRKLPALARTYQPQARWRARWPHLSGASVERISMTASAARSAHPAHLDIPYAAKERTKWDLYPTADANVPCLVHIHGGYQRAR